MQINGSFEEFSNYIKSNYDINDKLIEIKYEHSKRVANLMILIASKMNLSKREMLLAYFIGLFHDLGRFEQAVREHKFDNSNFDHAAYSNKILFKDDFISNFDIPHELYDVIKTAVYFHNKKDIPNDLEGSYELYTKLIRDADKIDIIRVMTENFKQSFTSVPKNEIMDAYLNNQTIDTKLIENLSERVVLNLSFMKDLYFLESKEVLSKTGNKEKYLESVLVDTKLEEMFLFLVSQIDRKEKKYVK